MKIRCSPHLIAFILAAAIVTVGLLLYPRYAYNRRATSNFEAAHALWQSARLSGYTATVISNSRTQSTGGVNTIKVENGVLISGHNLQCPTCSLESFSAFTIEALFQRIEAECLHEFPTQFCNVAYDITFGYPLRIDTHPYERDGQERPSITVEKVLVDVKLND